MTTAFITKDDIEDEVLQPLITESDLNYASSQLVQLAAALGVSESEIVIPVKDNVLQYVIALACEQRANYSIGTATTSFADGRDVYVIKQAIYAKKIIKLENIITANMLLQDISDKSDLSATIELYRT